MAVTSKIGSRGQITLPKDIRERFQLQEGQTVAFVVKNDELTLLPLTQTLLDFEGAIAVDGPQDFARVREAVQQAQAERIAKGD